MKLAIIGNGVAGVTTARLVADHGSGIEITIYSAEPYPYYPRPRLIDLLAGGIGFDAMPLYPPEWYAQRGIRTVLNHEAVQLDPVNHTVSFGDGDKQSYDRLVLAAGARCFVPPIGGVGTEGVFTLRTLDDAQAILKRLEQTRQAVVLGGGLLGLDTAAALRARGAEVCVVEMLPRLLPRQLDAEGASVLAEMIQKTGIQVVTGDICAQITGTPAVQQVHLKSGQVIDAGMVIISAGVRANVSLAQAAGLVCTKGVVVNDRLQTSHPDIYAVGDVAEFNQTNWSIIPAALAQARVAAAQIAGEVETLYQDIAPSTSLQVTGIDLTSIGMVNPEGSNGCIQVRRTDRDRGIYRKLVIRDGRVVGAIALGDRSDVRAMSQLISRGTDVTAHLDELLREDFDLASLLR